MPSISWTLSICIVNSTTQSVTDCCYSRHILHGQFPPLKEVPRGSVVSSYTTAVIISLIFVMSPLPPHLRRTRPSQKMGEGKTSSKRNKISRTARKRVDIVSIGTRQRFTAYKLCVWYEQHKNTEGNRAKMTKNTTRTRSEKEMQKFRKNE